MSPEHDKLTAPESPADSPETQPSPAEENQEPNPISGTAAGTAAAAAAAEEKPADPPPPEPEAPSEAAEASPPADSPKTPETAEAPSTTEAAETSAEALDQLIDQYSVTQQVPSEGQTVEGRVVEITDAGVVVDIGGKSEGLIPAQEFVEDGAITLEPGQTIEVQFLNQHKDGYALFSYTRVRRRRAWESIERSFREQAPITGRVVDRIKGGLVVDIGVRAFLPASQADLRPVRELDGWKDQEITCRVLKMNRKRGNVVVSRRVILEEELTSKREQLLAAITEGAVVTGKVKNVTDYGVFVDLGGLDGLLHVTDLTWGRISHPSEVVKVGDEIEVQVLKLDREKMRVSLGRKQLEEDPWATVPERFAPGSRIEGRVVGVTDYGAFVELAPGVEGLVHISEMTWSKRLKHPSKIVQVGDQVIVAVLDVKPEQRRISLGLKQTQPDPWQSLADRYPIGTVVTGRIRNLTDFGAFVEIEEGIDGLIHISDISWSERVKHPSETFKKGETVEAKVLKVDAENRRLSLGVKQLNDTWADWFAAHHANEVLRGRVVRATNFGVFVELAEGIEGLCHISEIEGRRGRGKEREKPARAEKPALEIGQEYDFKILRIDPDQHKIALSYRAAKKQSERQEIAEYRSSKSSSTATIGDAILSKREMS
jgi:small subunit ribosomal protein S1